MTDIPSLTRQLRNLAAGLLADNTSENQGYLCDVAETLTLIAEQLRGQTLVKLPDSDEDHRWHLDAGIVEAVADGRHQVILVDPADVMAPDEARQLGLALVAAAARTTCHCSPNEGAPWHLHSQGGYRTEDVTA